MHRRLGASLLALISLLLLLGSAPTVALAPEPMVAVTEGEASAAEPPPSEPERRCADGSLARAAGSAASAPGVRTVQPGPLVAVPRLMPPRQGPQTSCLHDISLSLEITSPDGRKPEGVDAWFDEVLVNQGSLEAGFMTTQPATDRSITLKKPPSDWEVVGASCTCGGAARSDGITLASYPSPVVAVHTLPSGSCTGSVPSASATASSASAPRAGISLSLTITAPNGRRPQGVDAWFEEVLVTQGALESGYHTNQPAADRSITLKQPPSEWEVVGLSCTCGGATAAATPVRAQAERTSVFQLASYPGPVWSGSGSLAAVPARCRRPLRRPRSRAPQPGPHGQQAPWS